MSDLMRRRAMMQGDDYLKGWEFNKALNSKRVLVDAVGYCVSPFLEVDTSINTRFWNVYNFPKCEYFTVGYYDENYKNLGGISARNYDDASWAFVATNTKYVRLTRSMERIDDCYFRYNNGPYIWAGKNVKQ